MPAQLRCRDLKPGDIMLKVPDGSAVAAVIRAGQTVTGGLNPHVIHAGVMLDSTRIVEAQSAGIVRHDLRSDNRAYGYYVYRCTNPRVAQGAGTCAELMSDIHTAHRGPLRPSLGYSALGAAGSIFGGRGRAATPATMDTLLDRILDGKTHRFFCSQFVVYVYQFVAEQNGMSAATLFNYADAKVAPSRLAAALQGHRLFAEAGYVMPGER